MAATHSVRPHVLDTWMALLAGDRVWHQRADGPPTTREQGVSAIMVGALVIVVVVLWLTLTSRIGLSGPLDERDRGLVALVVAGTAAAGLLAARPIRLMRGRRPAPAGFWWSICWRGAACLTVTVATAAVIPSLRFLGTVPLGIAGGTDSLLTMWALGLTPQPALWIRRSLVSPLHFGALGALIGTLTLNTDGVPTGAALGMYAAMWTGVVVAGATVLAASTFNTIVVAEQRAQWDDLRNRERELRLHWLHDDVLSEIKLATLRIEVDGDAAAARRELEDLDHRLRLRQLEEAIRGGRPHLYEIIQPHLRRVQSVGVRIDRVPTLDRTSRRLDEATGQLVHRAVSNLISNAVNAGARSISLAIDEVADPPALDIAVTDDAGGFSLDDLTPGRGLWLLRRDLGTDRVWRDDAPHGSVVTVRVPLDPSAVPRPQEATP